MGLSTKRIESLITNPTKELTNSRILYLRPNGVIKEMTVSTLEREGFIVYYMMNYASKRFSEDDYIDESKDKISYINNYSNILTKCKIEMEK